MTSSVIFVFRDSLRVIQMIITFQNFNASNTVGTISTLVMYLVPTNMKFSILS